MKYMGSKRWMLGNGLGDLLSSEAPKAGRFVDLFSGSAAVAWHVAGSTDVPVLAVDLQAYSAVLGRAVLGRTREMGSSRVLTQWLASAHARTATAGWHRRAEEIAQRPLTRRLVIDSRELSRTGPGPITRAYGGHYYSPGQAAMIDALRASLPARDPHRSVCLAALIWAAARCAAAPGHTAQPFQPTRTALPFIAVAWSKRLDGAVAEVLGTIGALKARTRGEAIVGDALQAAEQNVTSSDLVFIDPPYSAVQYSRFYHVLETIARGDCEPVSGTGRYPPPGERPSSLFSQKSEAARALQTMLATLREKGCRVIMTFPQRPCSNGLDGEEIVSAAREWYEIDVKPVVLRHSTLGGNNTYRASRRSAQELIMLMRPRRRRMRRARVYHHTAE